MLFHHCYCCPWSLKNYDPLKKLSAETLTLLVPGLLDGVAHLDRVPAQELPDLACFSCLLSRGKLRYFDKRDYYSYLFDYFSIDPQHSEFPAVAPVDYFYQHYPQGYSLQDQAGGVIERRWVMRADPCFMTPDRDQLVLLESDKIDLSYHEATQLIADINNFFQPFAEENFWQLELSPEISSPLSWFISSTQPMNIYSQPTSRVKGHSIKPFLLTGENQSSWLKLFNEIQMVLHQSEVNRQRRLQGKLPVNSVWFWGAGQFIAPFDKTSENNENIVFSNDPVVKGLSQLAHYKLHELPHNADELFIKTNMGCAVVVMDHLIESVREADVYAWIDLMKQFEKEWLEPIFSALKSGQLNQLILLSPTGIELKVTRRHLNHWWKRIQRYTHFMQK